MERPVNKSEDASTRFRSRRLMIWAVIFNFSLYVQLRHGGKGDFLLLIPYIAGLVLGWIIHPLFRPRRDLWARSPYDRSSMRLLRSLMMGGLLAFCTQIALSITEK